MKDPINTLIKKISDEEFVKNSHKKIEEIDKAFSYAQKDSFSEPEEAYQGIFADESLNEEDIVCSSNK